MSLKKAALITVGMGVGLALCVAAPVVVLPALGFGAKGVIAGSVAAKTMSVVYGAQTCGVISVMTSAGMAGVSTATTIGLATTGGATGAYVASKL